MAESEVFAWVAKELEERTHLSRLEARGTVRLMLKDAGLDPNSVAAYQMDVVLMRLMPAALNKRRVTDAEQLCHEIADKLRAGGTSLSEPPMEDTAYDVFARLDAEGPEGKRR